MRMIDADELVAEMKKRQDKVAEWRDRARSENIRIRADGVLGAFIEFKQTIDKMPTVEGTPEIKVGKWMRYGEDGNPNTEDTVFWQCSECMETYTGRTTRIPNFCPNCGSEMR